MNQEGFVYFEHTFNTKNQIPRNAVFNMKLQLYLLKTLIISIMIMLALGANGQRNSGGLELLDESLFIGGLSPAVMTKGDVEVNFYSALFSSWIGLHESATVESPIRDRLRLTDFNTNLETYFGMSRNGRWDIGARLRYGRLRLANAASDSPFDVFSSSDAESSNIGTDKTYSGLREIGIRFRLVPFENVEGLSVNAGYSFGSIGNSNDDAGFVLADRNSVDVNLTYYISLNPNSFYYFIFSGKSSGAGSLPQTAEALHNTTGSFFIAQRLGPIVVYPGISYSLDFKPPSQGSFSDKALIKQGEQVLGTLGIQFNPSYNLSFNINASIPFIISTTNLRQRLIRESYSFVSIGGRILL